MADEDAPKMLCPLWERCYGALCNHNTPHKEITEKWHQCKSKWCSKIAEEIGGCNEVTDELLVYYTLMDEILHDKWLSEVREL